MTPKPKKVTSRAPSNTILRYFGKEMALRKNSPAKSSRESPAKSPVRSSADSPAISLSSESPAKSLSSESPAISLSSESPARSPLRSSADSPAMTYAKSPAKSELSVGTGIANTRSKSPRKPHLSAGKKIATSVKMRKFKKESMIKLKRMLQERAEHDQEQKEIGEIRARFEKTMNAAENEIEEHKHVSLVDVSLPPNYAEVHPGREVLVPSKKYQISTFGELISGGADKYPSIEDIRALLQLKMLSSTTVLERCDMKRLFYLMSLDQDYIVSESCYHYLCLNCDRWIPKINHIVNVFTNWGATYETLCMTEVDISTAYPLNVPKKNPTQLNAPNFSYFHFQHVFSYLKTVIQNSNNYSESEILLLLKILIVISLDNGNCRISDTVKKTGLIHVCVQHIKEWGSAKVIDVAKYIYDEKETFHNQIAIATSVIPNFSRCNDIRSCLSFTILSMMILQEKHFQFPHEDEDLWKVVQRIETTSLSKEDLSKLYLVIYLIHSVVRARNMISKENPILKKIENHMETVKNDVVRQYKTFDADLLKGRIAYCRAIWQLLAEQSQS